jgi:hypothetical protein
MNILYIVPDLQKVSGGPRTRISSFKEIFLKKGGKVIEKGSKLSRSIVPQRINLVYVESATNRVGIVDVICLFFLRIYSQKVIVFIRDIYVEMFPEKYSDLRGKFTRLANRISNYYLTLIATKLVFPTNYMGAMFFKINRCFPTRNYSSLPPGSRKEKTPHKPPDFTKKLGVLYLGSTRYVNSGFETFIDFSLKYSNSYSFYVLSGDNGMSDVNSTFPINFDSIKRDQIPDYIKQNNIAYAIHTRPRNKYDDITFPIKVLDFLSLGLPFISEQHKPIESLLSEKYPLFLDLKNKDEIHNKIKSISKEDYYYLLNLFKTISKENSYEKRYIELLEK